MSVLDRRVQEVAAMLAATYPVFAELRPLAIGIFDRLTERHPDIEPRILRLALLSYCLRPGYHRAVAEGAERYGLDGQPAGEITDKQREHARKARAETVAKIRAEKRRKRELVKAAQLAAERKQEKLAKMEAALKAKAAKAAAKEAAKAPPPKPAAQLTAPVSKSGRPILVLKKPAKLAKGEPPAREG